jgi:hypothetical protein
MNENRIVRTEVRPEGMRDGVKQGVTSRAMCGTGFSLASLACLASVASLPLLIIGAMRWARALPDSRDLFTGKLMVGLSQGLVWGCTCVAISCIGGGLVKGLCDDAEHVRNQAAGHH